MLPGASYTLDVLNNLFSKSMVLKSFLCYRVKIQTLTISLKFKKEKSLKKIVNNSTVGFSM